MVKKVIDWSKFWIAWLEVSAACVVGVCALSRVLGDGIWQCVKYDGKPSLDYQRQRQWK